MSLISKDKLPWGICLICITTLAQDNKDAIHPEAVYRVLSEGACIIRM